MIYWMKTSLLSDAEVSEGESESSARSPLGGSDV